MSKAKSNKKSDKAEKPLDNSGLRPFTVTFTDGHYSVLQCRSPEHCKSRVLAEYPTKTVYNIEYVL